MLSSVNPRYGLTSHSTSAFKSRAEVGKAPTAYKSKSRESEALLVDYICGRISGDSSQLIEDIIDGDITVGNAGSLGKETAEEWQDKLDKIQTTAVGAIPTIGWYRVAKYETNDNRHASGYYGNSCDLTLRRTSSGTQSEVHTLRFHNTYGGKAEFVSLGDKSGTHTFTKCRHVIDGVTAYIEVYYDYLATSDNLFCMVANGKDHQFCWEAITPTLTEETVDGVTVTTTYDIPANATPATNLDIDAAMTAFTYPAQYGATEEEINELYNSLHTSLIPGYTHYFAVIGHMIAHSVLQGGSWFVEGYRSSASNGWQRASSYDTSSFRSYKRSIHNGVWTPWVKDLDSAGGTISNEEAALDFYSTASEQRMRLTVTRNGNFGIYDHTNSKWILQVDNTGQVNIEPSALENYLPKTGGDVGSLWFNNRKSLISVSPEHFVLAQLEVGEDLNNCNILSIYSGDASTALVLQNNTNGVAKTYPLLHTGNKPNGSYTGNGSTTRDPINIGGIGDIVKVTNSATGVAIVTSVGAICASSSGVTFVPVSEAKYADGVLTLATKNSCLNANGYSYSYQVL